MPREERERRYIAEYMQLYYPQGGWILNVPLGPIPEEIVSKYGVVNGAALYRPSRPRIDAVFPQTSHYLLIEAKIREPKAAIGDLLVYHSLAEKTPDLPGYHGQIFVMRLVVPWALDWIRLAAQEHKMELTEFLPEWVEEYVRERQNYFTREYRITRAEKMRLRKTFGLE